MRGAFAETDDAFHLLAARDHVLERQRAGTALVDATDFFFERIGAQRVLDRKLQPLRADGFYDEIVRARAHRRNHRFDRTMRRLHDGRDGDLSFAQAAEDAHAVEVGHDQIEDEQIDGRQVGRVDARQSGLAAVDGLGIVAETTHHCL